MKKILFSIIIFICLLPCVAYATGGFGGGTHGGGSFGNGGFGSDSVYSDCQLSYQSLVDLVISVNDGIKAGDYSNPPWGNQDVAAEIVEWTDDGTAMRYRIGVKYSSNNTYYYTYYHCPSGGFYYAYKDTDNEYFLKPIIDILNFIKTKVSDLVTYISNISGKVSNIYDSIGVKSSTYTLISDLHTVQQRTTTINTSCTSIKASLISIDANITTIDANISGIATACATMNNTVSGIASAVANMNNSFSVGGLHINTSNSDPLYTSTVPDTLFSTPYSTYDGNTLPTLIIPYESGTALISDINSDMQLAPITHISNDGTSTSTRYIVSAYLDDNNLIRVSYRSGTVGSPVYNGFLCDERQRLYKVDSQSFGIDHWSDFIIMMSTIQTTLNQIKSGIDTSNSELSRITHSLDTINTSVHTVDSSINNLLNYVDNKEFISTPRLVSWLSDYSGYLSNIVSTPFEKYFVKLFGSSWLFENIPNDYYIMPYLENPWMGYNYE